MCSFSRPSIPPPAPAPIPETPPQVSNATTKRDAPRQAKSTSAIETATSTNVRKRRGRGSLRIPLTSSGLTGTGLNFPTS
tara:strand:- start:372 stop:611 length:240 start_codon:yes stop_codon:yes gene_type:complete